MNTSKIKGTRPTGTRHTATKKWPGGEAVFLLLVDNKDYWYTDGTAALKAYSRAVKSNVKTELYCGRNANQMRLVKSRESAIET